MFVLLCTSLLQFALDEPRVALGDVAHIGQTGIGALRTIRPVPAPTLFHIGLGEFPHFNTLRDPGAFLPDRLGQAHSDRASEVPEDQSG